MHHLRSVWFTDDVQIIKEKRKSEHTGSYAASELEALVELWKRPTLDKQYEDRTIEDIIEGQRQQSTRHREFQIDNALNMARQLEAQLYSWLNETVTLMFNDQHDRYRVGAATIEAWIKEWSSVAENLSKAVEMLPVSSDASLRAKRARALFRQFILKERLALRQEHLAIASDAALLFEQLKDWRDRVVEKLQYRIAEDRKRLLKTNKQLDAVIRYVVVLLLSPTCTDLGFVALLHLRNAVKVHCGICYLMPRKSGEKLSTTEWKQSAWLNGYARIGTC